MKTQVPPFEHLERAESICLTLAAAVYEDLSDASGGLADVVREPGEGGQFVLVEGGSFEGDVVVHFVGLFFFVE